VIKWGEFITFSQKFRILKVSDKHIHLHCLCSCLYEACWTWKGETTIRYRCPISSVGGLWWFWSFTIACRSSSCEVSARNYITTTVDRIMLTIIWNIIFLTPNLHACDCNLISANDFWISFLYSIHHFIFWVNKDMRILEHQHWYILRAMPNWFHCIQGWWILKRILEQRKMTLICSRKPLLLIAMKIANNAWAI